MTTYGCKRCEALAYDMWGDDFYCVDCYKTVTHAVRRKLEEMVEVYQENRTDVVNNLEAILEGRDQPITTESRFVHAVLETPCGSYTIEYDTLTTLMSDANSGQTLDTHIYIGDEER